MAARLAPRLARRAFTRVLVSPLRRARETCALAGFDARAEVLSDLAEWDYGALEGQTDEEYTRAHPGWALWVDGGPGGESVDALGARMDRVIEVLTGSSGDVLVFAHGHCLRVLAARWLGLSATQGRALALGPASLSCLIRGREGRMILHWNEQEDSLAPSP